MGSGDGREVQQGGDIRILMADFTLLYSRNQDNTVKQFLQLKLKKKKEIHFSCIKLGKNDSETLGNNRDTLNSGLSSSKPQGYLKFILTPKSLPAPQMMLCN